MLDWDKTQIVFTKRSLLEFLKYVRFLLAPGSFNSHSAIHPTILAKR